MSSSVLSGKIEFIQYHKPGLVSGDYTITVTQTVTGSKIQGSNSTFQDTKSFSVAGPRFDLPPQDIYEMFPPPGNHGDHSNVLPHIILNRSTLPWERDIQSTRGNQPWLALLVFHQSDIEQGRVSEPKIIKLSELIEDSSQSGSWFPDFKLEIAQRESDKVTVIDVQKSLLNVILPSFEDLPYLAHVRQRKELSVDIDESYLAQLNECKEGSTQAAEDIFKEEFAAFKEEIKQGGIRLFGACSIACRQNGTKKEWVITDAENGKQYVAREDSVQQKKVLNVFTNDAEVAIVIANRLPQRGGLTTVHLVSLENRFIDKIDEPKKVFDYREKDLVRFVSLKSWSFSCTDPDRNFKQILLHLNQDTLRLPEAKNDYLNQGYVALNYYLRKGGKTIAWYHSPLRPCKTTDRLYSLKKTDSPPEKKGWHIKSEMNQTHYYWGDRTQNTLYQVTPFFGANLRVSDQLLCIDQKSGLFETTYAAAWQLGRLLALQDQHFSVALTQWKRNHVQQFHQRRQAIADPHLQLFNNLPSLNAPSEVNTWFDKLNQLQGVPFNYLVPDARMLPEESIRFFQVDPLWIDCLLDGAFSLGRCTETDQLQDFYHIIASNRYPITSGLLLRSEAVSGWAGLLVDGYYKLSKDIESELKMQDQEIRASALPNLKQNLHRIGIPLPDKLRIQQTDGIETWTLTDLDTSPDYVETIVGDANNPQLCMMMPDRDRQYNYTIINNKDKEYYLKLPLLRMERLANDVLLCLFQGDIHRVDIHLKPETLHFGLKKLKEDFSKDLKNKDGSEAKTNDQTQSPSVNLDHKNWKVSPDSPSLPGTRSLNVKNLVTEIEGKLNLTLNTLTSDQFALQMIEGSDLVRFTVEEEKAVKS
ncbi:MULTISPECIES: hypothetical protein [Leptolyngbya]|uniref:hypothetical protein n=1 Tax=Leptolyngbya TaxID=47251 RepID=UPI001684C822|nr:hypothetical protein [Leptolyngbya sp. FACHB-1624]MBD1857652.1 hypothetical protein [Leptolyngbya sp. FACHB-1624]